MPDTRWQPTPLIRATLVLHALALLAVIVEPGQWRWALGAVLANHALLTLLGVVATQPLAGAELDTTACRCHSQK